MTIHTAFSEKESLNILTNGANIGVETDTSIAISGVNRAGFNMGNSATAEHVFTAEDEGYVHFILKAGATNSGRSNQVVFALRQTGSALPLVEIRRVGTTAALEIRIVPEGATFYSFLAVSTATTVDIRFKVHASTGYVEIYKNGVSFRSYLAADTSFASGTQSVEKLFFEAGTTSTSGTLYGEKYSQIIASDVTTIGSKVYTLPVTTGSVMDWAGTVSDVAGTDFGTPVSEDTNNGIMRLNPDTMPAIGAFEDIVSLILAINAEYETGSAVTKVRGLVHDGSTYTYDAAAQTLTTAYLPYKFKYDLNPVTAAVWTVANVNAYQLGLRAET